MDMECLLIAQSLSFSRVALGVGSSSRLIVRFTAWLRANNEALPYQDISPKLAELAAGLAKPALEDEDFEA